MAPSSHRARLSDSHLTSTSAPSSSHPAEPAPSAHVRHTSGLPPSASPAAHQAAERARADRAARISARPPTPRQAGSLSRDSDADADADAEAEADAGSTASSRSSRSGRTARSRSHSRSRSRSGQHGALRPRPSVRSVRSKVSFQSILTAGSHEGAPLLRPRRGSDSDPDKTESEQAAALEPWDPPFGATRGIGPAGEAMEVIALGRKEPRHRNFASGMLKSALRRGSMGHLGGGSGSGPGDEGSAAGQGNSWLAQLRDKPMPSRPTSAVEPACTEPYGPASVPRGAERPPRSRHSAQPSSLRGLFSHLNLTHSPARAVAMERDRPAPQPLSTLRVPVENLAEYLQRATIPRWTGLGSASNETPGSSLFGLRSGSRAKGHDAMPYEWHVRLRAADVGRAEGRALLGWGESGKRWQRDVSDWCKTIVPSHLIDKSDRSGEQVFALPAEGYQTLEYIDDRAAKSPDGGLMNWFVGTTLRTVMSVLHMLRPLSLSFGFHLVPSHTTGPSRGSACFFDGFGTMVLMHSRHQARRTMVVEVRPRSIVSNGAMREFARRSRPEGWWHLPSEACVGDLGQANLLQAQVYDSCVSNGVSRFAVTNLKYWVFGQFDPNYRQCTVGPLIERKQGGPSVLQCLVAWAVQSIDERPHPGLDPPRTPQSLPHPRSLRPEPLPTSADAHRHRQHRSSRSHRPHVSPEQPVQPYTPPSPPRPPAAPLAPPVSAAHPYPTQPTPVHWPDFDAYPYHPQPYPQPFVHYPYGTLNSPPGYFESIGEPAFSSGSSAMSYSLPYPAYQQYGSWSPGQAYGARQAAYTPDGHGAWYNG